MTNARGRLFVALVVALATLVAALPTLATASAPATPAPIRAATGRFYVVGRDIVGPDGRKFIPVGGNVGAAMTPWWPPYYAFTSQGYYAQTHSADALAWGWNMVRVNVACNPGPGVSLPQTVAGVQQVIDEFTARHIVVMPECHDVTGANAPLSDPRYRAIHAFWDAILTRNGSNPYVWVNYVNEPFTGGAATGWRDVGRWLYARVRSKGVENLFVWDFPFHAQGAAEVAGPAGSDFVAGTCNVALSWHSYGAAGSMQAMDAYAQEMLRRNLAVIVGEAGFDWAGRRAHSTTVANERIGAVWAMWNAYRFGFGVLWWHATGTRSGDDPYSTRVGGRGAWYGGTSRPLSAGGRALLDVGRSRPPAPPLAVDVAASGCPSAA